jgi:hypothetical protein
MKEKAFDPKPLKELEQRFKGWRSQRQQGTRIPEPLWEAALAVARTHGVSRVAQVLRLGYPQLRKRLEQTRSAAIVPVVSPAFVELAYDRSKEQPGCTIELENRLGAKMTIRFSNSSPAETVALAELFWRRSR